MNPTLLQSVVRVADARTPDAELLSRFTRNRDERAFEELVRRHGPLVWAICRHLLTHHADAEDAFQAVFLALVRGASSIHVGKALPAWLHGVAVRVATKARRSAVRRRQREQRAAVPEADWPVPDESWATLMTVVHEEVRQLPEGERTAFVLCDLEGVRQPDAAARLGWSLGTLSGRLCKARQRLLDQLTRRGIAPTVMGVGGIAGVAGSVPAALVQRVTSFSAAMVGVSSTVAELARGLVEGTTMRMKIVAATLLVVGALGMSGGALVLSQADAQTGAGSRGGPPPGGASDGGGFPPRGGAENPMGPGGRPGAPGLARPSTGLLSGEGSGMMGSGMATMGGSPSWEYKFVDLKGDDRDTFTKAITDAGRDGWEFGGSERLRKGGEPQLVLVFKKPKGIGFHLGGAGMGMPGMGAFGGGGMGMPGAGGGSSFGGGRGGAGGFELPMMGLGGGDARFGGAAGVEARTFKLKNTGAGDVAKAVETSSAFKGKTFKVIAEPVSNMIIVVADMAAMREITRVIEELDAKPNHVPAGPGRGPPPAGGGTGSSSARPAPGGVAGLNPMGGPGGAPARGEIRIIRLKNATAQEMSPVIGRVFPNADVTPEPRSNQLIIRSDDTTAAEIEALITRLDVEGPLKR